MKKLKLYHIALLAPGEPNTAITRSFIQAGFDVVEINWLTFVKQLGYKIFREHVLKECQLIRPDIIFMQLQTAEVITPDLADKLKEMAFVVNWTGDVRENIDWYAKLADHINLTLFTNRTDVNKLRALGKEADYLQIGYDESIYHNNNPGKRDRYEIVFCGNNYASGNFNFPLSNERAVMVQSMKNAFKSEFQLFGNGWANTHYIHANTEADVYRRSLIGLNQNHFEYENFSSDRILRVMACGAMCITRWFPGIETEYEDGVHLRVYHNLQELHQLCRFYLDNDAERIEIAVNGRKLVESKYRWVNRAETLKSFYYMNMWNLKSVKKFRKYSQSFEDGYLEQLLKNIDKERDGFLVDIGAGDGYSISNTKYFRADKNYKYILLDGNNHGNEEVHQEWITRENICQLLIQFNCPPEFELLSLDLDGNDFWILEEVLTEFTPSVIIAEINPIFKRYEAFVMEYNPNHKWKENDYYGMSLHALEKLAYRFGYSIVFCSDSLNAYLVHSKHLPIGIQTFQLDYTEKHDHAPGTGTWIKID